MTHVQPDGRRCVTCGVVEFVQLHAAERRHAPRSPSWLVPPLSGSATPAYLGYYDESVTVPGFLPPDPWVSPTAPPGGERSELWELHDRHAIPTVPPNSATRPNSGAGG